MLYTGHMKLILGIGNPERQYDGTRHNVGFQMLDKIAADAGVSFKRSDKFRADIAEISMSGEKALLIKPTTYYNLVGESARSLLDFYKLSPEDFLIIHDDLALPLGTVRTRVGGSDGGNNGLKSLSAHVGTETTRIRIGVWTDHHHGTDKVSVVLGKFTQAERTALEAIGPTISRLVRDFMNGSLEITTHRHTLDAE